MGSQSQKEIAVIGAGTMGSSIAQLFIQNREIVVMVDTNRESLEMAEKRIYEQVTLLKKEGVLAEDSDSILSRLRATKQLEAAKSSTVVIEAVPEKLELKQRLFEELETLCSRETIFATNTSGLSINEIARDLHHPERVIGTHFFTPAAIIPLVEVIRGSKTSERTIQRTMTLLKKVGKKPVLINRDIPGFIGNRIQHAIAREAIALLEKGIATAEDIDTVVRWSIGLRLLFTGPLEQRDINGLDVHHDIASYLYKDLDNRIEPSPLLTEKIKKGELGLKKGKGFYDWGNIRSSKIMVQKNHELIKLLQWLNGIHERKGE